LKKPIRICPIASFTFTPLVFWFPLEDDSGMLPNNVCTVLQEQLTMLLTWHPACHIRLQGNSFTTCVSCVALLAICMYANMFLSEFTPPVRHDRSIELFALRGILWRILPSCPCLAASTAVFAPAKIAPAGLVTTFTEAVLC
jgi:hypothetical protein